MKKNTHPLVKGTLLLTAAGLSSRIIGFFYRIFLVSLIGAEGIGIYQMVFPLYLLCVTLSSSGIQTAVSRFTAESMSGGDVRSAKKLFAVGLFAASVPAVISALLLYLLADPISRCFLHEQRTYPLLRVMAAAIPFEVIHACVSSSFLGRKKTLAPAALQLTEQLVRVGAAVLIYRILLQKQMAVSPLLAAYGLFLAELTAALLSITALVFSFPHTAAADKQPTLPGKDKAAHAFSVPLPSGLTLKQAAASIGKVAFPITCSRVLLNLLQSAEAAMIPWRLRLYYENADMALSAYGMLTGMAMPLILFPSAITGSFSMLLLPSISEAHALENSKKIGDLICRSLQFSLSLGIWFTAFFLQFGPALGQLLYHNESLGSCLETLAWICPFFYLNAILSSILHGLGKTMDVFLHNVAGLVLRLLCTWFLLPAFGIRGCLWGVLVSQLAASLLGLLSLRRAVRFSFSAIQSILIPAVNCMTASAALRILYALLPAMRTTAWSTFLLSGGIWGCILLLRTSLHMSLF